MGDSDDAFEVFMEQLDLRVGGLDADSLVGLINLLQQDRRGQIRPFTDEQIGIMLSNCGGGHSMKAMDTAVMDTVLSKLQDPQQISVMHQIGRKQLQKFIVQLTSRQTSELVIFLAPFFTKYTEHFVDSLSTDQKAEVFEDIMPCVVNTAVAEKNVAPMLASLYEPTDLATAIEFLGLNKIILGKKKERRQQASSSSKARHKVSKKERGSDTKKKKQAAPEDTHLPEDYGVEDDNVANKEDEASSEEEISVR